MKVRFPYTINLNSHRKSESPKGSILPLTFDVPDNKIASLLFKVQPHSKLAVQSPTAQRKEKQSPKKE
jgi:hypothetical protein